jgi:peptidoglycan-associated lipoprotein
MNKTLLYPLLAALGAALVAGCDTVPVRDEGADPGAPVVEDRTTAPGAEGATGAETRGMRGGGAFQGHPLDDPQSPLATRVIYFDFDRAEVREEFRPVVEAHAGYLADNPGAQVTLEGHTDERGSREYNLGLGERRAQSVERLLTLLGAGGDQVRTVSYGEEQPAAEGHDEAAWSQNRRVEIIYLAR